MKYWCHRYKVIYIYIISEIHTCNYIVLFPHHQIVIACYSKTNIKNKSIWKRSPITFVRTIHHGVLPHRVVLQISFIRERQTNLYRGGSLIIECKKSSAWSIPWCWRPTWGGYIIVIINECLMFNIRFSIVFFLVQWEHMWLYC